MTSNPEIPEIFISKYFILFPVINKFKSFFGDVQGFSAILKIYDFVDFLVDKMRINAGYGFFFFFFFFFSLN
jgi:hypothetical protein